MHIYAWHTDLTSQASIDALNTATPHLAHLMADLAYILCKKPLHQISFIYSTMHIYPWQIDTPQVSIDAFNTATPHLAHFMADLA